MPLRDNRQLPEPVRARLGPEWLATRQAGFDVAQRGLILEARRVSSVEIRTKKNGDPVLDGYATVYEASYPIAGGPPFGWNETIGSGAATKSVAENDDVRLLVNHDGIPLARSGPRSTTLELESDKLGLRVSATLDPSSPLVQSVRSAIDRGDLDEMSFAFQAVRQEWNEDFTERRISEVRLHDVSIVTYPANPATVAVMRAELPAPAFPLSLAQSQAERLRLSI